jgi:HEAT repeat protein
VYLAFSLSEMSLAMFRGIQLKWALRSLQSDNAKKRWRAAHALGRIKDGRAVEPLIAALQDQNILLHRAAVQALGEIKDGRAVEPLLRTLESEGQIDFLEIGIVSYSLIEIGTAAVEPLIAALQDHNLLEGQRGVAAKALGHIRDTRATFPLIAALRDQSGNVRKEAAWSLGHPVYHQAVDPLITVLLTDQDRDVRAAAAQALGEMKDGRAVEPLVKSLQDQDRDVRVATVQALGEMKDGRAVEPLTAALQDQDRDVRVAAVQALREIKDGRAVEPLLKAMMVDGYGVEPILKAMMVDGYGVEPFMADTDPRILENFLTEIGTAAVEPLIAALQDHNLHEFQRSEAAKALGHIRDTRATFPLIAALRDQSGYVQAAAAQALGEINDGRAVEPLMAALQKEKARGRYRNTDMQQKTEEALRRINEYLRIERMINKS